MSGLLLLCYLVSASSFGYIGFPNYQAKFNKERISSDKSNVRIPVMLLTRSGRHCPLLKTAIVQLDRGCYWGHSSHRRVARISALRQPSENFPHLVISGSKPSENLPQAIIPSSNDGLNETTEQSSDLTGGDWSIDTPFASVSAPEEINHNNSNPSQEGSRSAFFVQNAFALAGAAVLLCFVIWEAHAAQLAAAHAHSVGPKLNLLSSALSETTEGVGSEREEAGSGGKGTLAYSGKAITTERLYDGWLPRILVALPSQACFYLAYDSLNYCFELAPPPFLRTVQGVVDPLQQHLASSLLSTLPSNAIRIPNEAIKQRMQSGADSSALTAAVAILRREGVLGLYTGAAAMLGRELPWTAWQFVTFSELSRRVTEAHGGAALTPVESAVLGLVAAGSAALVTQPMDVVKTRLMVERRSGLVGELRMIWSTEGLSGLWSGARERVLIVGVGGAVYFWAHELVRGIMP